MMNLSPINFAMTNESLEKDNSTPNCKLLKFFVQVYKSFYYFNEQ